ncbi:MAG: TetR/AcrR family transcriptional regulator C-terminal domain-containing protein, partial [Firmicutes bacterium]|nr:TetR/AcrR family transcriptional regulator C-terminal domain-containing protein [Bacillota bacterium]
LRQFINAELFLIDDTKRRGLSKFLTSYFLIDISYAMEIQKGKNPHENFTKWLVKAKLDNKINFESAALTSQIFYGMVEGCLTWPALMSNGLTLQFKEPLIEEIISTFLNQYSVKK